MDKEESFAQLQAGQERQRERIGALNAYGSAPARRAEVERQRARVGGVSWRPRLPEPRRTVMTVDEALEGLVEASGLDDGHVYVETLRRYVEEVREVERTLAAGVSVMCCEDEITNDLMIEYGDRLAAARKGRGHD